MPRATLLLPALAILLASAACGSTATPTSPSATTETFNGTVSIGSSDSHTFTASQSGEVSLTLTAAGPPATIAMGIGFGVPNGSACTLLEGGSTTTAAGAAPQVKGLVSGGTLCVEVYDVGNATSPVTYTVSVSHP
jgi:hypothetical protein